MSDATHRDPRIGPRIELKVVFGALAEFRKANYELFRTAQTDEERRMAQARAQVLDGFETALKAVVDAGHRETLEQERRDRAPAPRQPRRSRPMAGGRGARR